MGSIEIVLGSAAVVSAGVLAYAVRVPSCSLLAPSVHRGSTARPAIALTFDDGPSESTPELLEILARYRAPATFFQMRSECSRACPKSPARSPRPDMKSATTLTRIRCWR